MTIRRSDTARVLSIALAILGLAPWSRAAALKAVQTGTTTIPAVTVSATATLSPAVDTTKSFLVFGVSENTADPRCGQISGQITNATTVTFARAATAGCPAVVMKWYVAEFSSGVRVERGTYDWEAAGYPVNPAIAIPGVPLDLTKSFPILGYRLNGANFDGNDLLRARLTGPNTLQINASAVGPVMPQVIEWQAIEYTGATVQTGNVQFAGATLTQTRAAPADFTAVDPARSWLMYTFEDTAQFIDDPGKRAIRGQITSGSTLTFDRLHDDGASGQVVDLTWHLVEFTDGTTVRRGSEPFAATETQRDVDLGTAVTVDNSIATAGGEFFRGGRTGYGMNAGTSTQDIPGVAWFNLDLTTSTNLRITRGAADPAVPACAPVCPATADVGWFVITFPPASGPPMLVKSGYYQGNGSAGRPIYVGFQPDAVFVKRVGGAPDVNAVLRTSMMTLDNTKSLDNAGVALAPNLIQSLTTTGFTVGSATAVNEGAGAPCPAGCDYYWVAFKAAAGEMKVGTYGGNGMPTQSVALVGFKPEYVIVLPPGAGDPNGIPVWVSSTLPADTSFDFDATQRGPNAIRALEMDGFQVGNGGVAPNRPNLTAAGTFHYVAWNAVPGRMAVGTYTGNGVDDRNLDVTGFFPEWAIIKKFPDPPVESTVIHKPASTGVNTDIGLRFAEVVPVPDTIQSLRPLGFQVGSDQRVNFNDVSVTGCNGPCTYHWVAFGPHVPQTNYRSIGTAGPHGAGTITATVGSPIVTGVLTGWRTANRGRGDSITFGGFTGTILSVDSETQLTLTSPSTVGGSPAYTISRKFTTLDLWENCIDGGGTPCGPDPMVSSSSLVADDRREVGIAYKDSVFSNTTPVFIMGSTTDSQHDITLTADHGNRHYGIAGNGVILDNSVNCCAAFEITDAFVTVEWLEIRSPGAGGTRATHIGGFPPPSNRVVLRNNLIHDIPNNAIQLFDPRTVDVYDNIIYSALRGIQLEVGAAGSTVRIFNNTIFNCTVLAPGGINSDAASNPGVTLRNNLVHSSNGDFNVPGLNPASSHNLASNATGITHSPGGGGLDNVPLAGAPGVNFVDDTAPGINLHLQGTSFAVNKGADLSAVFTSDIDNVIRLVPWEIGADDTSQTTAVTLLSFTALPLNGAVDLSWATASELQNLGFHLHRADSADGPYTRITSALIPGLGSSPTGQSYGYRDTGLVNGRTYYYELEDVETTGKTQRHGPVSATPSPGAGSPPAPPPPDPSGATTYGDPSGVVLREIERDARQVLVELLTPGFTATPADGGRVRLSIPGFESASGPGQPDLPMRRALVAAAAGRKVRLASVVASDVHGYPGLRPMPGSVPGIEASADGSILPSPGHAAEGSAYGRVFPAASARLEGVVFQGETKKANLLLSPLRWDGNSLELSRRLLVRLDFVGREAAETGLGGSQGRRVVARGSHGRRGVVAQLVVRDRGLHRVDYGDVFSGRSEVLASNLRLSRQGTSVAFHVEPNPGRFGPGSSLYFLSEGSSLNPYGDAVYELETGVRGMLMPVERLVPDSTPVSEEIATLNREENRYYQAGLLDAPDLWLWDIVVSPASKSYPFTVDHVSSLSPGRVSVSLQGASDFEGVTDHHVKVRVNGVMVGEGIWDGRRPQTVDAEVGAGVLHEGANSLDLENVGDTGAAYSFVFLNRFSLRYPRALVATQGKLEGSFAVSGQAAIDGLSSASLLLDTTESPRWLTGGSATASGLSFPVQAGRSYLATRTVLRPEVRRIQARSLKDATNRADYLLLAPKAFLTAAQPLLDWRESHGLVTKAVSLEDVYEQFGHGETSPAAIKEFLEYAYQFWASPSLRYVLLLGDASYDPKDYLKTGVVNWLPGFPVKTSYLWTVSDPAYASVNGNDLVPDVAIGRLPAGSVEEAQRLVQKVLVFENGGGNFDGRAVLVADNADLAGNFEQDADEIAATILASRNPRKIYYSREGANTRAEIEDAFDQGASFLSYVGHGGTVVWASENIFNYQDVASLRPQSQQPLLLTMNCLNGFFHFPPLNSLSEELLKADGKGVIAAFSPSGLSVNDAAHLYHKAVLQEILSGKYERLGDAILAAQEDYAHTGAFPELLSIYHLFGDPAMRIR